jgi:aminopeptidase N
MPTSTRGHSLGPLSHEEFTDAHCHHRYSAPVIVTSNASSDDLSFLAANDRYSVVGNVRLAFVFLSFALPSFGSDEFNRWNALHKLSMNTLLSTLKHINIHSPSTSTVRVPPFPLPNDFVKAFQNTLMHPTLDSAFVAHALTLPSETMVAEEVDVVDPHAIRKVPPILWIAPFNSTHKPLIYCM